MKYKFFKIAVNSPAAAEAELNAFCSRQSIVTIEKIFVADGADSFWTICATWTDSDGPLAAAATKKKSKIDYKEALNDDDFTIYAQLRDLRKAIAIREATPAYNIFTNEQLAAIVQQRVTSKTALLALEGVGQTRVAKYGDEFLQLLGTISWPDAGGETEQE